MRYVIATFREAGLDARWTRTRAGAPIIAARDPARTEDTNWYVVDARMWSDMCLRGVKQVFLDHTLLGKFFSIRV